MALACACFAALLAAAEPASSSRTLRAVRQPEPGTLLLEADGPLDYAYSSPDSLTLVIDLPGVDAASVAAHLAPPTPPIASLRLAPYGDRPGARLEIRLAEPCTQRITGSPTGLVLAFERAASTPALVPASSPPAPTPIASPPLDPPPSPPASVPTAIPEPAAELPGVRSSPAAVPPAPEPQARRNATSVLDVSVTGEGDEVAIVVRADGRLNHRDFLVPNPDRLVVDMDDATNRIRASGIDVNRGGVTRVRLSQFSLTPRVVRLVVDLQRTTPHRVVDAADGLTILLGVRPPTTP